MGSIWAKSILLKVRRKMGRGAIDNLVKLTEEAAAQGNTRDLYNTIKKLSVLHQLTHKPRQGRKNINNRGTAKEISKALSEVLEI